MDVVSIFLKDLRHCPRFTREEERALWERMKAGDIEARNQLALSVLPLAVRLARRYWFRNQCDQTSVACEAALDAAMAFDAEKARLTTYVHWRIKQVIHEYLRHYHVIHIPSGILEGRGSPSRLASAEAAMNVCSLNYGVAAERDDGIGQILTDGVPSALDTVIAEEEFQVSLAERYYCDWLLSKIPRRMRTVLQRRHRGEKLSSIADDYGLSKERIRQLESMGLSSLQQLAAEHPFSVWKSAH